jgi:hypothetical protein
LLWQRVKKYFKTTMRGLQKTQEAMCGSSHL